MTQEQFCRGLVVFGTLLAFATFATFILVVAVRAL